MKKDKRICKDFRVFDPKKKKLKIYLLTQYSQVCGNQLLSISAEVKYRSYGLQLKKKINFFKINFLTVAFFTK